MKSSVTAGVVLGVVVALWTVVFAVTGMYKNPIAALLFVVVAIAINVVVVVWGLRKTRDEGRRYGGQVVAGLVMGIVAAVLIFANSLLMTQVLFPTYTEDILAAQEEMLTSAGLPAEQVEARVERARASMTPMAQATNGAIGTIVTTLVVTLIAAAFVRKKD